MPNNTDKNDNMNLESQFAEIMTLFKKNIESSEDDRRKNELFRDAIKERISGIESSLALVVENVSSEKMAKRDDKVNYLELNQNTIQNDIKSLMDHNSVTVRQLERLSDKLDRMDERMDKVEQIKASHSTRLQSLNDNSKEQKDEMKKLAEKYVDLAIKIGGAGGIAYLLIEKFAN